MSDLEKKLPMDPEQIETYQFPTAFVGYDRRRVEEFAKQVSAQMRELATELASARAALEKAEENARNDSGPAQSAPAPAGESEGELAAAYRKLGDETAKILIAAEQAAEAIRHRAKLESAEVIALARQEAGKIAQDARYGRQEAEEDLRKLRLTRGLLAEQLEDVRRRLSEAVARLEAPAEVAAGRRQDRDARAQPGDDASPGPTPAAQAPPAQPARPGMPGAGDKAPEPMASEPSTTQPRTAERKSAIPAPAGPSAAESELAEAARAEPDASDLNKPPQEVSEPAVDRKSAKPKVPAQPVQPKEPPEPAPVSKTPVAPMSPPAADEPAAHEPKLPAVEPAPPGRAPVGEAAIVEAPIQAPGPSRPIKAPAMVPEVAAANGTRNGASNGRAATAAPPEDAVERLLDEIRQEREASIAQAPSGRTASDEAPAELAEGESGGREARDLQLLQARAQSLGDMPFEAARRLKRLLQEDQNELLHRLRTQRGKGTLEENIGPEQEQLRRFRNGLQQVLTKAFWEGRKAAGEPGPGNPAGTVEALIANHVLMPLRAEVSGIVEAGLAAGDTPTAVSERAGDVFRVWKGVRTELVGEAAVYSAFSQGFIDALSSVREATKRWVLSEEEQCPQQVCAGNAAQGTIGIQAAFASGHPAPPAHPGCTCTLDRR